MYVCMCVCMWRGPERPSVDRTSLCVYVCMCVCGHPTQLTPPTLPRPSQPSCLAPFSGGFGETCQAAWPALPRSRQPSCLAPFLGVSGELAGQPGQPCPVLQPPCPVLSPPLPSYVCMQSPLPSYTRSHPCPVMYVCMQPRCPVMRPPCPVVQPPLPSHAAIPAQLHTWRRPKRPMYVCM